MGSISKSVACDVGKNGDATKPRRVKYKNERRSEKFPRGVTERFVDLQGNVVTCQLVSPGVPATNDAVARERANLHGRKNGDGTVVGYVEHGKCPLRYGVEHRHPVLADEFAAMPAELRRHNCTEDPIVASRHRDAAGVVVAYEDGCPHIQWLIGERVVKAKARADRRGNSMSARDIELAKLKLMEETNQKLVEAVAERKPRRGAE